MKFGSVCSGIEAASVAWNPLGLEAAWFSEIEKFPSAVLAHHYPDVPNLGDMTLLSERILSSEVEAPDILCGGTPCQAFSVAGNRQSLDDARGNLTLTFCEIADAIDTVRIRNNDKNVPGVLNTKDNAFGCFLGQLAGEDLPLEPAGKKWTNAGVVLGSKRAVAWRVLDAQYFGVAQRRRRVYVVASAREGFCPAKVLFESEGVRRDSAPSRRERKETTGDALQGFDKQRIGEYSDNNVASTCAARDYKDASDLVVTMGDVAGTLDANYYKGQGSRQGGEREFVAHTFKVRCGCEGGGKGYLGQDEQAFTLSTTHDQHLFTQREVRPINTMTVQGRPSDDLNPRMGSGIGEPSDPQNTLSTAHHHGVFDSHIMAVRRLTPTECERLQGFPDGYTDIKPNGKDTPDGSRYKALGNSWAVPVVRWIGSRMINEVQK